MLKSFLFIFLFSLAHALFAGEKAAQILEEYSFSVSEQAQIFSKFPELTNLEIASELKTQSEQDAFILKLYADYTNDVYIIKKDEKVEIEKTFVPFEMSVKTIEGEIRGSLNETLMKDTSSEKIATQITNAFAEEFTNTKGLKVVATYSLDVVEYFDNGRFVKYGDVQKAQLQVGLAVAVKTIQQDINTLSWSLQPNVPEKNDRPFYAPVKISRVSSLFQLARRHPVKRRLQPHNGIDFVASSGTPVFPALEGEIIAMGRAKAKGKFILIQHENGYQTTYDHLRKFTKHLRVGMHVEMNDQIGEVGRTGYATGAHLHFGVVKDGLYVNPLYLVKDYTFAQKDQFETSDLEETGVEEEVGI